MDSNIVASIDAQTRRAPPTLESVGVDRVIGRTILAWKGNYGSYGMGGPGFFGLHLEATPTSPSEHLVLTVWGADGWLLYDGRWIAAHPNQYHFARPWTSDFGDDQEWDELTLRILPGRIVSMTATNNSCAIAIETNDGAHLLELPSDTSRLSVLGGTLLQRVWSPSDHPLAAWVLCGGDLRV